MMAEVVKRHKSFISDSSPHFLAGVPLTAIFGLWGNQEKREVKSSTPSLLQVPRSFHTHVFESLIPMNSVWFFRLFTKVLIPLYWTIAFFFLLKCLLFCVLF
jgi:hypothetical protein